MKQKKNNSHHKKKPFLFSLIAFGLMMLLSFNSYADIKEVSEQTALQIIKNAPKNQIFAVQFHASWCYTCVKQKKALEKFSKSLNKKDPLIYIVDYDQSKSLQDIYNIMNQSTIILIKNKLIIDRIVGETNIEKLKEFLGGLN